MAAELVDQRMMELLMNESPFRTVLDERMIASWNHARFAQRINEIMDAELRRHLDTLHKRIDGVGSRTEHVFQDKRAEKLAPPDFHGRTDKNLTFDNFADQFKNWAAAIYERGILTVNAAENLGEELPTIKARLQDPNLEAFSGRIYEVLLRAAKGETKTFVKNPQRDGLAAWRRMVQEYDPREQVDATIAYEQITRPTPAKNIGEARVKLPQWLNEAGLYTAKFGDAALTEPARILALKTLIPATILGNRFVGHRYADHKDYVRDLEDFIGDRSVQELRANLSRPKDPSAMDLDAMLEGSTESLSEETKAEIMSLIRKNPGNNNGQGYGGKGANSDNGQGNGGKGWRGRGGNKGSGKGYGGKGDEGKGYGKATRSEWKETRECYNCHRKGHLARDCNKSWKRSIYNVGEESEQDNQDDKYQDDDREEDGDNLCMLCDAPGNYVHKNPFQALSENADRKEKNEDQVEKEKNEAVINPKDKHAAQTVTNKKKDAVKAGKEWIQVGNAINCLEDYDTAIEQMLCEVGDAKNSKGVKWERVEAAVDSAAVDNVMPYKMFPHIPTKPSPRSIAGKHYVAANDIEIRNFGQRRIKFKTDDGAQKNIVFQSAEVGRCLISVDKLNDAGCDVVLKKKDPKIITSKGEVIKLKKKNGVFVMTMWIKINEESNNMDIDEAQGFNRQGR